MDSVTGVATFPGIELDPSLPDGSYDFIFYSDGHELDLALPERFGTTQPGPLGLFATNVWPISEYGPFVKGGS